MIDAGVFTLAVGGCPITRSILNPDMILYPFDTSLNSVFAKDTNRIYREVITEKSKALRELFNGLTSTSESENSE